MTTLLDFVRALAPKGPELRTRSFRSRSRWPESVIRLQAIITDTEYEFPLVAEAARILRRGLVRESSPMTTHAIFVGGLGALPSLPRPIAAVRTAARRAAGLESHDHPPVVFERGGAAPRVVGHQAYYTTRTGGHIWHQGAYARVGWSSMVYHASTRGVVVGEDWLPPQSP